LSHSKNGLIDHNEVLTIFFLAPKYRQEFYKVLKKSKQQTEIEVVLLWR